MATSDPIFDKQGADLIPTRIGQIVNGCTFAAVMHTRNSISALLVTPKHLHRDLPLLRSSSIRSMRTSFLHGEENTRIHLQDSSPAAEYCSQLEYNNVAGFYVPSSMEITAILSQLLRGVRFTADSKTITYSIPRKWCSDLLVVRYSAESASRLMATKFLTSSTVSSNTRVLTVSPHHFGKSLIDCTQAATVCPIRKIVIV